MNKKVRSILVLIVFAIPGFGQIIDKIDQKLLSGGKLKQQNVVVLLQEQADVSGVTSVKGKIEKATFVYDKLRNTAVNSQDEVIDFLRNKGVVYRSYYIVNMISLKADWSLIQSLAALHSVRAVIEDGNFVLSETRADRTIDGSRAIEWNVTRINASAVWNLGYTGQNVVIGGQDTGYEWNDPVLINKYRGWNGTTANHNYNWHDAIHEDNPLSGGSNDCGFNNQQPCDDNNHGTHTMGTMIGDDGQGNQVGVAPGAKWIGCRNMENGWGTLTSYVECFEWFLAPYPLSGGAGDPSKMPDVINNSWGCPTDEGCNNTNFAVMESALNNLRSAGCVIVVSAGNSGSNCSTVQDPPAIFSGSFSVGATNNTDGIAGFSSRGPVTVDGSNRLKPDISAPGVGVRSCIRGSNAFASWNGTSMAGPHVAGLVALLISANPSLAGEVDKIEEIIKQTAVHLTSAQTCGTVPGTTIPNNTFGYGRIDALAAVTMAIPANYPPFINYNSSVVINNSQNGIVLVSPNLSKYRIKVNNTGQITTTSITNESAQSLVHRQASMNILNNTSTYILKSDNGNLWQLNMDDAGKFTTSQVGNLPVPNYNIPTGDIYIENSLKGIQLRSPNNSCYLVHVSNLGNVLTIPTVCQN